MFTAAKPIIEDASKLAAVGSMLPGVGPIAASSAVLLNTIARLKITSVAPTNDYVWSVQKVASIQRDGLLQGVKWTISKNLFVELGSRLTGSIAGNLIADAAAVMPGVKGTAARAAAEAVNRTVWRRLRRPELP